MRILIAACSCWPEVGGVQSVVLNLAQQARKAGHEPIIVAPITAELSERDIFDGIPIYRLPFIAPEASRHFLKFGATFWKSMTGLRQIISDFQPDVINVHFVSTGNSLYSILASKLFGIPMVASVHGEDILSMPLRSTTARHISRTALRNCVAATACSAYMADEAVKLAGITPSKIRVIRNGVDLAEFNAAGCHPTPHRAGILSLGRFVSKKGFDVLIKAFSLVKVRVPSARLTLAGDGPERAYLEDLINRMELRDCVELPGMISHDRVVRELEKCEVFVLPSRSEPLGIAVLEAMAAGTPVVATKVGGVPEIVENEKNGLIVYPENYYRMAEAIIRLLHDERLRERLSAEGLRTVEQDFSWENTGRQFLSVLESAAASTTGKMINEKENTCALEVEG